MGKAAAKHIQYDYDIYTFIVVIFLLIFFQKELNLYQLYDTIYVIVIEYFGEAIAWQSF